MRRLRSFLVAFLGLLLATVEAASCRQTLRANPGVTAEARARPQSAAAGPSFNGGRAFEVLKHLVALGPRPPGSKALDEARGYIKDQLKQAGCNVEEDSFTASTPVGNVPMTNLIAKAAGAKPGIIMLAGHYDTARHDDFRFVGANDGGSSAAMLVELARIFCRRSNLWTVWLVFFDGEEALVRWSDSDSLYGSRHLAQKLELDGRIARIQAMLLVDMVGDQHLDVNRDSNSTVWLNDLVFKTAARLGYGKYFLDEQAAYQDDHIPFVNAGVAGVDLLGNVGPPSASSSFGRYWHTAEDTADKCSPSSLTIVGRVVVATVEELDRQPRSH